MSFDATKPALVLAPHMVLPPRNGSDLLVERTARHLATHVPYVDVLTAEDVVRYAEGAQVSSKAHGGQMRSKTVGALRTVLLRSHYYKEKFLTPDFQRLASTYLAYPTYGTVLASYITTSTLVDATARPKRCLVVLTHNDEFRWFRDLYRATTNPVGRWAARSSERWLYRYLRKHRDTFIYAHVTQADQAGFEREVPGMQSIVVPIGADLADDPAPARPPDAEPVRLLFVGSLGVQMNADALRYFGLKFFPLLHQTLGDKLAVDVVGSNPSVAVETLCNQHGWHLHANVSDEELQAHYHDALFALMPFEYATGAKLKLLGALGHGVPVLATQQVRAQEALFAAPSLMSDSPDAWVSHIQALQAQGISSEARKRLRDVARAHSWEASVQKMVATLQAME